MMHMSRVLGRIGIIIGWTGVLLALVMVTSGYRIFAPAKEITVFAWGDMFDEDIIAAFEQETGITVNLSFYGTNEELLAKLRAMNGHGYDLVVPSDYVVSKLIHEELVQPIDHSQLTFYNAINPVLLGHFFDPDNRYAIPFEWELYGIGINEYCKPQSDVIEHPWRCLFEPYRTFLRDQSHAIAMSNDPVEAILFAAEYLYGDVDTLTRQQQDAIVDLLKKQRPWVEAYSNDRSEYYLATNNCCISVSQSSLIWRAMWQYPNIDFYLPHDRGFVTIEHCVIPVGSDKSDLVYQFLNYIYSRESFKEHFAQYAFIPARYDVIDDLPATDEQKRIMKSSPEQFQRLRFIRDIVPDDVKNYMWVDIKS